MSERASHANPAWDVVGLGANSVDFVNLLPGYPQPFGSFAKMQIRDRRVLCGGQTATANQGAVDYLLAHRPELVREHGLDGRFGLVLRIVQPAAYGRHSVELARDATRELFAPPLPVPSAAD